MIQLDIAAAFHFVVVALIVLSYKKIIKTINTYIPIDSNTHIHTHTHLKPLR